MTDKETDCEEAYYAAEPVGGERCLRCGGIVGYMDDRCPCCGMNYDLNADHVPRGDHRDHGGA